MTDEMLFFLTSSTEVLKQRAQAPKCPLKDNGQFIIDTPWADFDAATSHNWQLHLFRVWEGKQKCLSLL